MAVTAGGGVYVLAANGDSVTLYGTVKNIAISGFVVSKYYRLYLGSTGGPCIWEFKTGSSLTCEKFSEAVCINPGGAPLVLDTDDTSTPSFKVFVNVG